MKITLAQLNPTVGDLDGNLQKITEVVSKHHSDLVVFPELYLTGYPPRDLLEKEAFLQKTDDAVQRLCEISKKYPKTGILCGLPTVSEEKDGKGLYNSAVLISAGKILFKQDKTLLPTYDVFDEARYFDPSRRIGVVEFQGEKIGISICEDAWNEPHFWSGRRIYKANPLKKLAAQGATIFINISASPYHVGKEEIRFKIIRNQSRRYKIPFVYLNQVGANDELIFDGRSMVFDQEGKAILIAPSFQEHIETIDLFQAHTEISYRPQGKVESIYQALILGIKDYMKKTGFSKAVVGLSGGIDSALVVCLAAEAVGRENVLGISMPSPYSSLGSVEDSRKLAVNLGIDFKVIPISDIFRSYLSTLEEDFSGQEKDITEENIQARIRGALLMAFSNKFGSLLLSTGNKSEMAVGYCTLYGDMSGGLSVLSDVPKTMVYKLAHLINREKEVIPIEIIKKAPSAELRPEQRDEDSLPPYSILDQILQFYIEEGLSVKEIIDRGFECETVKWVIRAVDRNEYKRRQAAPGLKITPKAFGVGRRLPIAAKYDFQ